MQRAWRYPGAPPGWAAGYRNVTSCYGVNGFAEELLATLKARSAERILIAFDPDEPGGRAAEVLAKRLTGEGFACFRLRFPKGMLEYHAQKNGQLCVP